MHKIDLLKFPNDANTMGGWSNRDTKAGALEIITSGSTASPAGTSMLSAVLFIMGVQIFLWEGSIQIKYFQESMTQNKEDLKIDV